MHRAGSLCLSADINTESWSSYNLIKEKAAAAADSRQGEETGGYQRGELPGGGVQVGHQGIQPIRYRVGYMDILYNAGIIANAAAKSCPTLWDPIGDSPPGSSVPAILQARRLEWVAISSSQYSQYVNIIISSV